MYPTPEDVKAYQEKMIQDARRILDVEMTPLVVALPGRLDRMQYRLGNALISLGKKVRDASLYAKLYSEDERERQPVIEPIKKIQRCNIADERHQRKCNHRNLPATEMGSGHGV